MRRAATLFALALLVLAAQAALAQEAPPEGANPLGFADALCAAGDYYRAIGEYKRAIYLAPEGSPEADRARLRLAACAARAGDFAQAAELLGELAARPSPVAQPALFELGLMHYLAGEPQRAAETFGALAERYPEGPLAAEARLLAGLSLLAARNDDAAAEVFSGLPQPCAADLARAARHPALPEKSPALAGLLSAALPGAGQLYCGRPGQALASLALTGLSVLGAWAALTNDYLGAGTLASFVAATAYVGGIRSAATCAVRHNRQVRQRWITGLACGCGLTLQPGRVAFAY